MAENSIIQTGTKVTDFTLKDQNGNDFVLSANKGKKVLLSFHPLAWTGICAQQMKALEGKKKDFDAANTVAVGISVDSSPCKNAWAKELQVTETKLLSDFWPHGDVAQSLGVFREKEGFSERANIILDEEGTVIFTKVYPIMEVPDIEEIMNIIKV